MTTTRMDDLIDALLDQRYTADDLIELARDLEIDETARRRLDAALEGERTIRAGLEAVERTTARVGVTGMGRSIARRHRRRRAAAAMACTLLLGLGLGIGSMHLFRHPATTHIVSDEVDVDAYLQLAIASGRVLEEFPPVTVTVEELVDGEFEVVFLRRWLERARVDDIYRLAHDEHGRPVPVRTESAPKPRRESM